MPDRTIIYENALRVRAEIDDAARKAGRRPEEILLCAASKMHSAQDVIMAREAPNDVFGESRVQELLQKQEAQPLPTGLPKEPGSGLLPVLR